MLTYIRLDNKALWIPFAIILSFSTANNIKLNHTKINNTSKHEINNIANKISS